MSISSIGSAAATSGLSSGGFDASMDAEVQKREANQLKNAKIGTRIADNNAKKQNADKIQ